MEQYKQISIFDYEPPCIDFSHIIASGLIEHCKKWGYDYIEQLKACSGNSFYRIFCRTTKTYYIFRSPEEYYNVEFQKDGKAVIKRCGKDFREREPDAIIETQKIIDILLKRNI